MKKIISISMVYGLGMATLLPLSAYAQVRVEDNLNGTKSIYPWVATGGACLTHANIDPASYIPGCDTLAFYAKQTQVGGQEGVLPDVNQKGALRLTNGGPDGTFNTGSVISSQPFATNKGVQITFSTVTYGGNGAGSAVVEPGAKSAKTGADGIAFFLSDFDAGATLGGSGGSLGYSCSNVNAQANGVAGGYLGVAIDEYGNFSNRFDTTATPITVPSPTAPADPTKNIFTEGAHPGSVVVRGAGNINWNWLRANYPALYPNGKDHGDMVHKTCAAGKLINFSDNPETDPADTKNKLKPLDKSALVIYDYAYINGQTMPATTKLYSQQMPGVAVPKRSDADVFTYSLSISQARILNLSYSVNGGAASSIVKDLPIDNGPLPANFRFGFSSGTGGGTNVHEITCFKAEPITEAGTGAASSAQQGGQAQSDTQVFLSYYHALNSWGQLTAANIVYTPATKLFGISPTANWDAHCVLTGGVCQATGATTATVAQVPANRAVLSWNGTAGIVFEYDNLSAAQKTAIADSQAEGRARVAYIRGDRSNDFGAGSGLNYGFRIRDGILGDIKGSSPSLVNIPVQPYAKATGDLLFPAHDKTEFGDTYATFAAGKATRTHVVYTGSNDGFLHGFQAGSFNTNGTLNTSLNNGTEVLAFIPSAVVTTIHNKTNAKLDFSSTNYAHNAYIDAPPETGDVYYGGAWHTWLVSGLGGGGNLTGEINDGLTVSAGAVFALDVTDPSLFSKTNASVVVGEWGNEIKCANEPSSATCGENMGGIFGSPIIRKLHDGNWAAIFGNGRNSKSGVSGIFIMSIDKASTTGAVTWRFLKAGDAAVDGKGVLTAKNGIDQVTSADLDRDSVTDFVYAGDSQGGLYRFDLTSATPSAWSGTKIFNTPANEPISTKVTVNGIPQTGGAPRVMINFATGRQVPQSYLKKASFATGSQAIYGLWDSQLSGWNAKSSAKVAVLTIAQPVKPTLQTQTITTNVFNNPQIAGYRTSTQNPVCWVGSTVCGSAGTQYGWKVVLPVTNEQVIYSPVVALGALFVNTTVPVDNTLSCDAQPASGFSMAISLATGGAPDTSSFDDAAKNSGINSSAPVTGLGLSAVGAPNIVVVRLSDGTEKNVSVGQTTIGKPIAVELNKVGGGVGRRVTWKKLR